VRTSARAEAVALRDNEARQFGLLLVSLGLASLALATLELRRNSRTAIPFKALNSFKSWASVGLMWVFSLSSSRRASATVKTSEFSPRQRPPWASFTDRLDGARYGVSGSQAFGGLQRQKSLLPRQPRARPHLQDRVHSAISVGPGAAPADSARAPQSRATSRLGPRCVLRPARSNQRRELWEQMNTCSCLTLILACIVYWQAREISRVLSQWGSVANEVDLSMLEHVSPIEWDNVVLFGQYILDRRLVRRRRRAMRASA
jgi:hypothetical protein